MFKNDNFTIRMTKTEKNKTDMYKLTLINIFVFMYPPTISLRNTVNKIAKNKGQKTELIK